MENKKSKFTAVLSSIIAGIIVAMVVYFGLNFAGFKEYRASAKIVTTSVENLNEENPAEGFADVLNSKAIKERTLENLKIDWPLSKLDNKLNLKPIETSPIIEISVKDTNKLRAEDLADEYAELSVTVINNIYNTGANVMEYSYQNAASIDNTLNYATYAGLAGFLIYLIISLVGVARHNHKINKKNKKDYKKEEIKASEQVKKNKEAIEKEEDNFENDYEEDIDYDNDNIDNFEEEEIESNNFESIKEETRPLETVKEEEVEDLSATKKIDANDIAMAENSVKSNGKDQTIADGKANKLEILGKLPKYQRGALDV